MKKTTFKKTTFKLTKKPKNAPTRDALAALQKIARECAKAGVRRMDFAMAQDLEAAALSYGRALNKATRRSQTLRAGIRLKGGRS